MFVDSVASITASGKEKPQLSTMATKKKAPSKAYAFLHSSLKRNPKASFADLAEKAKKQKIKLPPVLYGKVKLDLGLVKRKPKVKKPGRPKKAAGSLLLKRGPGRPRKTESLDSIAAQIQQLQNERDRAVAALEEIRRVLS
jgi:hypothetical protein